jgi:hypothetical protein
MPNTLIQLTDDALHAARPDWQLSAWSTRREIRLGRLGCVRLGPRRIYLTPELMDEYIARHVTIGVMPKDPVRSEAAKRAAETRRAKQAQP